MSDRSACFCSSGAVGVRHVVGVTECVRVGVKVKCDTRGTNWRTTVFLQMSCFCFF